MEPMAEIILVIVVGYCEEGFASHLKLQNKPNIYLGIHTEAQKPNNKITDWEVVRVYGVSNNATMKEKNPFNEELNQVITPEGNNDFR